LVHLLVTLQVPMSRSICIDSISLRTFLVGPQHSHRRTSLHSVASSCHIKFYASLLSSVSVLSLHRVTVVSFLVLSFIGTHQFVPQPSYRSYAYFLVASTLCSDLTSCYFSQPLQHFQYTSQLITFTTC